MADGRLFKWGKVHIPQKALVYPLRDVCVQYEKYTPMDFSDLPRNSKRNADISADGHFGGRTSEVTLIPRPNFVGQGITIADTLTD